MNIITIIEIISILYFIAAVRMRVWRTSLNSFVVITASFVLLVSYECPYVRSHWMTYHLSIVAIVMTFIMVRVTYQSVNEKWKSYHCTTNNFDEKL